MLQLTGNHLSRYFRSRQICSHEINLPSAEIAILLSETASNDATNPRSRILVISWDDPGRETAPAYREALRSYGGSICPSISHGRCIGRTLKDADWPKPPQQDSRGCSHRCLRSGHFNAGFTKGYEVGMTNGVELKAIS